MSGEPPDLRGAPRFEGSTFPTISVAALRNPIEDPRTIKVSTENVQVLQALLRHRLRGIKLAHNEAGRSPHCVTPSFKRFFRNISWDLSVILFNLYLKIHLYDWPLR